MFGKKLPLKQPPPQVYQDQYSQDQSQPLIQQVDENYEPTQKQIRQYAIETLGMKLPEDQSLLYLAKQGLKAPIAANWVPYQSRNGQIYYKHNITQQKTYDHPTDTQYRKKFQQIKQKAARKNLKSVSLKQNLGMQGLPATSLVGGLGLINNSVLGGISNTSNISVAQDNTQMTIDQQTLMKYQADLIEYQRRQQKQWKQFQKQAQQQHQNKIKKIKQQATQQRNRLLNKNDKQIQSKILQQNKFRLQQQFQQSQQSSLQHQLRILQKQQQNRLQQYKAVYEQDNTLKIRKIQQQLQQNYNEKSKALQQKLRKLQQKRTKQRQSRLKTLQQARQQYEKPNNKQITNLLKITLEDNINNIKQQYMKKLKQKEDQLSHQLNEMKKILGVDKSQNLLALAHKKQKLLIISNMKISAKKNKQMQIIQNQFQRQLDNQKNRLKQKLLQVRQELIQVKKKQLQQRYQKNKILVENQLLQKTTRDIEQLYQNTTAQKNSYQGTMNKKMSQLRMKYINQISQTGNKKVNNTKQQKILNRVIIQQKQTQITNKQQQLKNLKRQLELERQTLKLLQFQNQVYRIFTQDQKNQKQLNSYLKGKIKQFNIVYKSPQLTNYIQIFKSYQEKYKQDKKLLIKILRGIQDTAAYNINEMRKNFYDSNTSSTNNGALIKKYNEDVRRLRQNEDILNKFQTLLKKTELGCNQYQQNLQNLKKFVNDEMNYKQIQLKIQMQQKGYVSSPKIYQNKQKQLYAHKLQQYDISEKNQKDKQPVADSKYKYQSWNINSSTTPVNTMEQALRQHSQFLSNVKNQLNKKLYQIRYQYRS